MRIAQVRSFLAIVESGSVTAAARQTGQSRTTVSTMLSALEDELGVSLFERRGNHLALTGIGRAIVTDCRRLDQVSEQIHSLCRHHRRGAESQLRIARDDSLPESLWRGVLASLKAEFPQTSVSVYLASPRELPGLVRRHAVDVAYGLMPEVMSEGYQWFRELADVRMMTVVSPQHPLAQRVRVDQDDLLDYTEITLAYLGDSGLVPESPESANYLAFTQYELIRDAVIEGQGWADLPFPLIRMTLREERLTVIRHRSAQWWRTFSALEAEQAQGGAVVGWLADALEKHLGPLA